MVDMWTKQSGLIVPGFEIGFCTATAAVTEGYAVKIGTHVADTVPITISAAQGDSMAVALKTAGIGAILPVCYYGVMKMTVGTGNIGTVSIGKFVGNISGGATIIQATSATVANYATFGGTSYILGMALQTGAGATGDTILVLIGKCM